MDITFTGFDQRNKIPQIKFIRSISGLGLKEAKDFWDSGAQSEGCIATLYQIEPRTIWSAQDLVEEIEDCGLRTDEEGMGLLVHEVEKAKIINMQNHKNEELFREIEILKEEVEIRKNQLRDADETIQGLRLMLEEMDKKSSETMILKIGDTTIQIHGANSVEVNS